MYLWFILTCSVGVVVTLQPGLHADQIMLIHKKDDVLGPVNLIYKPQHSLNVEYSCNTISVLSRCVV